MNNKDILNLLQQQALSNNSKRTKRGLYKEKVLDQTGINYGRYIKLYYESINNKDIANIYGVDGWYLLWYLMSKATNQEYIETTISSISKNIKLKDSKIKEVLIHLHKEKIINIIPNSNNKKLIKDLKVNDTIEIIMIYNSTGFNDREGYKIIPIDFIKTVLPTLTSIEWALYCVLVVHHSWYSVGSKYDPITGEEIFFHNENNYAFPTYEQMADIIGFTSKSSITKHIKTLEESEFKLIYLVGDGTKKYRNSKGQILNENKKYGVYLMNRIEYLYIQYYIYNLKLTNKLNSKDSDYISKEDYISYDKVKGTPNQYMLKDKDYIFSRYGDSLNKYHQTYINRDSNEYELCKGDMDLRNKY